MTSVNTNIAAMTALRTLQATNSAMEATQNRVSTGLKIGEAKDNAAYWSISTTLKSDNKSLATVKDALSLGAATVDTAYEGLNSAKDVLDELTKLVSSARQDGVDRTKIQAQIKQLQNQLKSNAESAVFSGENWLSVNSTNPSLYTNDKSVVASFNRASSGAITLGTIDINIANVKLFDSNNTIANKGILDTRVALKNATGGNMNNAGFSAGVAPSTTALNFAAPATGGAGSLAAGAKVELGTLNLAGVSGGDKITFTLNVDGTSNTVRLDTTGLDNSNFVSSLQSAVDLAVGNSKAVVKVGGSTTGTSGMVTIETATSTGTSSTISVGAITPVDGDGVTTSTAGLLTTGSLPAPKFGASFEASAEMNGPAATVFAVPAAHGSSTVATMNFGGTFAPLTTTATDTLTFTVNYNGVPKTITIGNGNNGVTFAAGTTSAADLQGFMNSAIQAQFAGTRSTHNGRLYVANDIQVNAGVTAVATAVKGSKESIQITGISGTGNLAGRAGLAAANATATGDVRYNGAGLTAGDTFSFTVQYGSTVRQINHTFTQSEFAPGGIAAWTTAGQPTAAEWETFLQNKINDAFLTGGTGAGGAWKFNGTGADYASGDIDVKQTGGVFSVETRKKGADMSVGISNVQASIYGVASTVGSAGSRLGLAENSISNYYTDAANPVKTAGAGVVGYGKATAPEQIVGVFDNTLVKGSDRISITINVGGTEKTVSVFTDGMLGTNAAKATDADIFKTRMQNALDAQFGGNVVTFGVAGASATPTPYAMTLKTVATGATSYLAISNVTALDGTGTPVNSMSTAGLQAGTGNLGITRNGSNVSSASTAVLASGTTFAGPQTIGANDSISFNIVLDTGLPGEAMTAITVDRDRVEAALPGQNGEIRNGADYAAVLNSAFTTAGIGGRVTASAPGNVLTLTRVGGPGAGSVAVTGITPSAGANTMSVAEIDLTDGRFTSLSSTEQKTAIDAYLNVVDAARKKVIAAASDLGSASKRIDLQQNFVNSLMDTIDKGVGALVDADITEESTKLQALQVKQQLGVQSLSLANQGAQQVLRLFQ
ncbi:flagellin N-terminal helical domain-containing protein [Antarcticirhabdus aurantiaca]|uniref:Flagellin n=1 Tax=Antarcticirhabdus aurantiaca TaxID=2606717 RepID=A0ACD4NHU1_9HYPH|nr:flagellin [Antarcticirhabdus aurantiaca]WAJ26395.1 flagellin [Jeongeuplla avenae]